MVSPRGHYTQNKTTCLAGKCLEDTSWDSYGDDDGALWWRLRGLWRKDGTLWEDEQQSKREEFIGSHGG
jgi:hypothetical protein